ncbi:hypothetical protein [Flavobacterium sp.]|uniref:hypothetical protein n=1 Tax=Flavobacterium sp. TaxID=239 RepID=UPI002C542682|nr:hypothetical protein [Flavobacterium sp.]HSD09293.1 hypothetical protein [Flavobacterium sp.]
MKTNKKAVLGFAVAMVFSLAFMQANSMKSTKQDISVQQVSVGAGYMAGASEGGASGGWVAVSAMTGGYATTVGGGLATTWFVSGTNPAGWVAWTSVGVAAL